MPKFNIYSKAELVEKVEALERLVQAQNRTIKELNQVISLHNWDRKMSEETISELIDQRNQLHECVKAHLKISDEARK